MLKMLACNKIHVYLCLPLYVQFGLPVALPRWSHPSCAFGARVVFGAVPRCAGDGGAALVTQILTSAAGRVHPVAIGLYMRLCGLVFRATSSRKINGLSSSFK